MRETLHLSEQKMFKIDEKKIEVKKILDGIMKFIALLD